jgi:hypothetical protein
MIHPNHVHPRSKRTAPATKYMPLHKPLVPVKAGASRARKANTYRGHADHVPQKLPTRYQPLVSYNRYAGSDLRAIRAVKGVGRPAAE